MSIPVVVTPFDSLTRMIKLITDLLEPKSSLGYKKGIMVRFFLSLNLLTLREQKVEVRVLGV